MARVKKASADSKADAKAKKLQKKADDKLKAIEKKDFIKDLERKGYTFYITLKKDMRGRKFYVNSNGTRVTKQSHTLQKTFIRKQKLLYPELSTKEIFKKQTAIEKKEIDEIKETDCYFEVYDRPKNSAVYTVLLGIQNKDGTQKTIVAEKKQYKFFVKSGKQRVEIDIHEFGKFVDDILMREFWEFVRKNPKIENYPILWFIANKTISFVYIDIDMIVSGSEPLQNLIQQTIKNHYDI
jgi:hypothetical protein